MPVFTSVFFFINYYSTLLHVIYFTLSFTVSDVSIRMSIYGTSAYSDLYLREQLTCSIIIWKFTPIEYVNCEWFLLCVKKTFTIVDSDILLIYDRKKEQIEEVKLIFANSRHFSSFLHLYSTGKNYFQFPT